MPDNGSTEEAKCEDIEKVVVGNDSERFFQVGSELPPQEREELIRFLRENVDVFVWDAYEASGVDLSFICHHLKFNPLLPRSNHLGTHRRSTLTPLGTR